MRRLLFSLFVILVLAAACGDDDDTTSDPPSTTTEAVPEATTTPPTTEAPAATTTTEAEAPATTAAPTDAPIAVVLAEFTITPDATIGAGPVTFAPVNEGEFPHRFGIAVGTSYEELPQLDNGAIDEEALGADFLGSTENLQPGETTTIDFDLAPGDYVLFCNVAVGPNSHAANGQTLSISVS